MMPKMMLNMIISDDDRHDAKKTYITGDVEHV
jgi:hypothetical protein